jgi:hypothetical protein
VLEKYEKWNRFSVQSDEVGWLVGWLAGKGRAERVCTYVRTPAGIKCLNHHQAAHNGVCHHTCYPRHALLDASSNQTNTRIFIYTFAVYGVVAHCTLACSIYWPALRVHTAAIHSFCRGGGGGTARCKIGCHLPRFRRRRNKSGNGR